MILPLKLRWNAQMLVLPRVFKLLVNFWSDFGGEAIEMLVFPRVFKDFCPGCWKAKATHYFRGKLQDTELKLHAYLLL